MKNTAKPLAERFHPLLPISIQVHKQSDPPCPLLGGFYGNLCYESNGEDGFHFPPHPQIGPYKDMEAVSENRRVPLNQVYSFDVVSLGGVHTKCLFWINRYDAERDLPDTGKGWKVNALVYFVTLAEMVKKWAAEEMCYELQLIVNGDTVKALGGFWADDEDTALEMAPVNWMEECAPSVWGVIPDKFQWSDRLKRAMNDLVRHDVGKERLEDLEGMTLNDFPTIEETEEYTGDYTDEDRAFVRAWHIARSVLSFDWSTATERTILTHRWWFSLEPSAEYDAPELTLSSRSCYGEMLPDGEPNPDFVNEGESPLYPDGYAEKWDTFFNDSWEGYWRMSWKGLWTGMPWQEVVFTIDRSAFEEDDDNEVVGNAMTLRDLRKSTSEVGFPWNQHLALTVFDQIAETIPYDESLPDGVVEAAYGRPVTAVISLKMPAL